MSPGRMQRRTEPEVQDRIDLPADGSGRLYRLIAERLRADITEGRFAAGTRLPAERDLARQFNVSRTSLREALIALEIGGYVEIRLGSGIYVADPVPFMRPLFDSVIAQPGPFELLRARWVVEGEVAAMAAAVIDDAMLARLQVALDVLRVADNRIGEQDEADRAFHLGIAEATGNSALLQSVRMYWDLRQGTMWTRLVEHFRTPALAAVVLTDHEEILDALRRRSPLQARQAMHRHLEHVVRDFAQSTGAPGEAGKNPDWLLPEHPDNGPLQDRIEARQMDFNETDSTEIDSRSGSTTHGD